MIKISIKENNIILNNNIKSISFVLSDVKDFISIKSYLSKINIETTIKLTVESLDRWYLVFADGYKLLINQITYFEFANRMILLNKKLIFPKVNIEESDI